MTRQSIPYTPVHVSERDIMPPSTISPIAQRVLSHGATLPNTVWPSANDKDAWRKWVAASDASREAANAAIIAGTGSTVATTNIAGVVCYDCTPRAGAPPGGPIYLFIHGGAFVVGAGRFAQAQGARGAAALSLRTLSVDYRMPPDHPFPAAAEDCFAVYKAMIETVPSKRIFIGGSSSGGNLAAAASLMIRDRGLPLPAGVILLSPEVDLTESGDSFRTNEDLDVVLKCGLAECNALYANGHDLHHPYLSPLFADFSKGFPPTLIQSGTRDLFLSNSVLLHRKLRNARVDAELHVWEAMPHGGFLPGEAPENEEIYAEVARFMGRLVG